MGCGMRRGAAVENSAAARPNGTQKTAIYNGFRSPRNPLASAGTPVWSLELRERHAAGARTRGGAREKRKVKPNSRAKWLMVESVRAAR